MSPPREALEFLFDPTVSTAAAAVVGLVLLLLVVRLVRRALERPTTRAEVCRRLDALRDATEDGVRRDQHGVPRRAASIHSPPEASYSPPEASSALSRHGSDLGSENGARDPVQAGALGTGGASGTRRSVSRGGRRHGGPHRRPAVAAKLDRVVEPTQGTGSNGAAGDQARHPG